MSFTGVVTDTSWSSDYCTAGPVTRSAARAVPPVESGHLGALRLPAAAAAAATATGPVATAGPAAPAGPVGGRDASAAAAAAPAVVEVVDAAATYRPAQVSCSTSRYSC